MSVRSQFLSTRVPPDGLVQTASQHRAEFQGKPLKEMEMEIEMEIEGEGREEMREEREGRKEEGRERRKKGGREMNETNRSCILFMTSQWKSHVSFSYYFLVEAIIAPSHFKSGDLTS